jgi:hypothetical protein
VCYEREKLSRRRTMLIESMTVYQGKGGAQGVFPWQR